MVLAVVVVLVVISLLVGVATVVLIWGVGWVGIWAITCGDHTLVSLFRERVIYSHCEFVGYCVRGKYVQVHVPWFRGDIGWWACLVGGACGLFVFWGECWSMLYCKSFREGVVVCWVV